MPGNCPARRIFDGHDGAVRSDGTHPSLSGRRKVADLFLQLPLSVAGALLVFTASIMLASGMQLMIARTLDTRFTFVIGLDLLFPLTRMVSTDYFDDLPGWLSIVTNSGLALGLTAAIGLLLVSRIVNIGKFMGGER